MAEVSDLSKHFYLTVGETSLIVKSVALEIVDRNNENNPKPNSTI
jgi:hypothetical protein